MSPEEVQEHVKDLPRVVIPRVEGSDIPAARRMMISRDVVDRYGPSEGCTKCQAISNGDYSNPSLGHSAGCRMRMEARMTEDPQMARRLDRARQRQDEYIARRVEAGDTAAKRPRGEVAEDVTLQPGPGGASESRVPDIDGEPMRSRGGSTVTYGEDEPVPDVDDVDLPMPTADEAPVPGPSSSSSGARVKRRHEGDVGDEGRAEVPDPEDPVDIEVGIVEDECPTVLMLGERKRAASKIGEGLHPGRYELCELFSPPRVTEKATERGLRGGWSLDLCHTDPITGSTWDLSEPKAQAQVWKMIRRDKPLVIGMSPECTLFSALQNLRKTEIPPAEMQRAIDCVVFCVEVANYQRSKSRFFSF